MKEETYYKKVLISDGLPEEEGWYETDLQLSYFRNGPTFEGWFNNEEDPSEDCKVLPRYWEKPLSPKEENELMKGSINMLTSKLEHLRQELEALQFQNGMLQTYIDMLKPPSYLKEEAVLFAEWVSRNYLITDMDNVYDDIDGSRYTLSELYDKFDKEIK